MPGSRPSPEETKGKKGKPKKKEKHLSKENQAIRGGLCRVTRWDTKKAQALFGAHDTSALSGIRKWHPWGGWLLVMLEIRPLVRNKVMDPGSERNQASGK